MDGVQSDERPAPGTPVMKQIAFSSLSRAVRTMVVRDEMALSRSSLAAGVANFEDLVVRIESHCRVNDRGESDGISRRPAPWDQ
jgi:hypothetical protein